MRNEYSLTNQSKGMYTIGVVCDISPIITSKKSGKKFTSFKLTDLVKYDLRLVTRVYQDAVDKKEITKDE